MNAKRLYLVFRELAVYGQEWAMEQIEILKSIAPA